jgi:hypothetical protein
MTLATTETTDPLVIVRTAWEAYSALLAILRDAVHWLPDETSLSRVLEHLTILADCHLAARLEESPDLAGELPLSTETQRELFQTLLMVASYSGMPGYADLHALLIRIAQGNRRDDS